MKNKMTHFTVHIDEKIEKVNAESRGFKCFKSKIRTCRYFFISIITG
jgi:hypothetical protein